ncbi:Coenzyme F420 hydrogenase/dehydrogenase, beta subunit C-terminal domain [Butyrivibrio sp. FC2001]|uniref:Coenzyme F420 hydrogenase/dehydrogenase, beta subunit C-terminal domain n=1 Tax=Butyrivibrio sp. FC2001 TaxID=1280671 RepID=UPI0003FB3FDA|nr:Coenzyme F420 hydrogenase/dehydrogenase, beta subunit C-terminal domain [Butyrivibrio sp. FC2001]
MENYPICLAAYSTDKDRIKSSSGGIFAEIAKRVIDNSGIVVGATIDTEGKVYHKYITTKEEIYDLMGSKYVQSDVGMVYKSVKSFLKEGKQVLFCGTPCQAQGLINYLRGKPDKLILMDFICHGVPSFKVFNTYLKEISEGREIDRINFRDKENGWLDYSFKVKYKNGDVFKTIFRDNNYMKGFIINFFLRPSCYECRFKGINRNTDITMGDFWGIEEEEPDFYDKNGVSVLLLHNEKAKQLITDISDVIVSKEIDVEEVIKHNPSLVKTSEKHIMHDLFFMTMRRGVNRAIEGIIKPNKLQKVRNKIYRGIYKLYSKTSLFQPKDKTTGKAPVLYTEKDKCCGCYACVNTCPKGIISMREDQEGFMYPVIDKNLCVGCNSCIKVCPINNSINKN